MPNQKLKSENYQQLGGINSKASPYTLGPQEFLDLTNFDFQTPGSLTKRWGSTFGIGQTFAAPVHTLNEISTTSGASYLVVGHSGGIWYGATTGQLQGASFSLTGVSTSVDPGAGGFCYDYSFSGSGALNFTSAATYINFGSTLSPARVSAYRFWNQNRASARSQISTFANVAFLTNGNQFHKFDGSRFTNIGCPPPIMAGSTILAASLGQANFVMDNYRTAFWGSFVSNTGHQGPLFPLAVVQHNNTAGLSLVAAVGSTVFTVKIDLYTDLAWGLSAINIYSYSVAGATTISVGTAGLGEDYPIHLLTSYPVSGSTLTTVFLGATTLSQKSLMNTNSNPSPGTAYEFNRERNHWGLTLSPPGASSEIVYVYDRNPALSEVYSNQVFLAGFTAAPSTFRYSELGEPENFPPQYQFEVRTNDGDVISCLKSYNQRLMVFKRNSTHQLTGDSIDNYVLSEVSADYGCLNARSAVTFTDLIAFLDRKGLVIYNGAGLNLASFKIQPLIDRINQSAAVTHAIVAHDKQRNQILVGVPLDGATLNNTTLVYDYVVNAWTKYTGFNPASFATIKSNAPDETIWFGDNSGRVGFQGASFMTDFGVGFTSSLQTRFLSELGQSVEKQWRRLFVNVDETTGATIPLTVDFLRNYGTTVALTRTMYSTPFQSRIDYGLSAKSLSFRLSESSTTTAIRVHGYTVEYRYQRGV